MLAQSLLKEEKNHTQTLLKEKMNHSKESTLTFKYCPIIFTKYQHCIIINQLSHCSIQVHRGQPMGP